MRIPLLQDAVSAVLPRSLRGEEERLGRYRVLARVGEGGMAVVYRAVAPGPAGFEKIVALKCIAPRYCKDPEFVEMLLEEARVAALLTHGNIVQVHGLEEVEGPEGTAYFIVMEFVEGIDLGGALQAASARAHPLPLGASLRIASETARALDYAHRKTDSTGAPLHLVHRDVSPQNILLTPEGEVKLADFGIARARGRIIETASGMIKGKVAYMSPEQASGEPIDGRSDLFSLGVVLYELVTGRRLFGGRDDVSTLKQVLAGRVDPAPRTLRPELPEPVERVLLAALARDPADRPGSAGAWAESLAAAASGVAGLGTPALLREWLAPIWSEPSATHATDPGLRRGPPPASALLPTAAAPLVARSMPEGRRSARWIGGAGLLGVLLAAIALLARGLRTSLPLPAPTVAPPPIEGPPPTPAPPVPRPVRPPPPPKRNRPPGRIELKVQPIGGRVTLLGTDRPEMAAVPWLIIRDLVPGRYRLRIRHTPSGRTRLVEMEVGEGEVVRRQIDFARDEEVEP